MTSPKNPFNLKAHALWRRAIDLEKKALEPGFRRGKTEEMAKKILTHCGQASTESVAFALLGDARGDVPRNASDKQALTGGRMGALRAALQQFPHPSNDPKINRDVRRLTILDVAYMAEFVVSPAANAAPHAQHFTLERCAATMDNLAGHDPRLDAFAREKIEAARQNLAPLAESGPRLRAGARREPPANVGC